jgi:hypothetical protein
MQTTDVKQSKNIVTKSKLIDLSQRIISSSWNYCRAAAIENLFPGSA